MGWAKNAGVEMGEKELEKKWVLSSTENKQCKGGERGERHQEETVDSSNRDRKGLGGDTVSPGI